MKAKILGGAAAAILLAGALAAERERAPAVMVLGHEQVAAAFATGGPLLATNNFKVQAGRRTGPGEVEIHDDDTDIFYLLEGSGTFVTGGQPVETRLVGPGETRGTSMRGGVEHHLTRGDIIVIPNHVPHWFREVNGPLIYYVVKVKQ